MSFPSNIEKEHLLKAFQKINQEGVSSLEDSNYYEVKFAEKFYPPKLVVSYANIYANGFELDRKTFEGGEGTPCFKLLEKHGFEIFTKELEELFSPDEVRKYLNHFKDDFLLMHFFEFASKVFHDGKFSETDKRIAFTLRKNGKWISLNVGRKLILAFYRTNGENHFCYYVSESDFEWASSLPGFKKEQAFGTSPPARLIYAAASIETLKNLELLEKVRNAFLEWLPSVDSSGQPERHNRLLFRLISDEHFREVFFKGQIVSKKTVESRVHVLIKTFIADSAKQNLNFSTYLTKRYIASLGTKPFVIFTGLSGSGKTKLAQTFAKWICESEKQYKIIPVGADWTNREPLLGYPNSLDSSKYVLPDNGALDLILAAIENAEGKDLSDCSPYFLILDEMNLSHVERYFADFLSGMESKESISLYTGNERKDEKGRAIPKEIKLPPNLFMVGTVNIDETTYMFSPKVLDRANTIEFRVDKIDLEAFFDAPNEEPTSAIEGSGVVYSKEFMEFVAQETESTNDYQRQLLGFFDALQPIGAEFGYRTANEMNRLMAQLKMIGLEKNEHALDVAVMQKLLPKLNGSRTKLNKVLSVLASFCFEICSPEQAKTLLDEVKRDGQLISSNKPTLPLSFSKIARMYVSAQENGFASYAEG